MSANRNLISRTNQEHKTALFAGVWSPAQYTQTLLKLNPNSSDYTDVAREILGRWQQTSSEASLVGQLPGAEVAGSMLSALANFVVPDSVKRRAEPAMKFAAARFNELGLEEGRLDWFQYCCKQRHLFAVTPDLWRALGFTLDDLEFLLKEEKSLLVYMMEQMSWYPLLLEFHKLYPTQAKPIVDSLFEFFSPKLLKSSSLYEYEHPAKNRLTLLGQIKEASDDLDKRLFTLVDDIWDIIKSPVYADQVPILKQWLRQLMEIPKSLDQRRVESMMVQWNGLQNDQRYQSLAKEYFEHALLPYLKQFRAQLIPHTRFRILESFWQQKQSIPVPIWQDLGYTSADIEELIQTLPAFLNELMNCKTPDDRDLLNVFLRQSNVFGEYVLHRCIENIVEAPERCQSWISLLQDVQQRVLQPQNSESTTRKILREAHRLKVVLPEAILRHLAYDKTDLIWIFQNIHIAIEGWLGNDGTMWFDLLKTFSKAEMERYRVAYLSACIQDGRPISARLWQLLNYNEQDIEWMFRHISPIFNRLTGESASLWHDNLIMMAEQSTLNAQAIHQCLWEQWVPMLPEINDSALQLLARVLQTLPSNEIVLNDLMTRYFSQANRKSYTVFEQFLLPYCQTHQAALSVDFKKRWVKHFMETQELTIADPLIAAFKIDEIAEITAEEKYQLFQQHQEQEPTTPSKMFLRRPDVTNLMKTRVQADAPPSPEELRTFHQMSPESYFDLVADPDLEAVELERMDVLLPGNAFPEENENHRLSDDCVRRLLINRKKPVDSTCHYHQPIIDEYEEFMAACDQALKKKAPKTGPLKAFLLSDPVRGAHWLDVMPAQTITEFQELFPWLASMQKPGDEIQFDPAKLEKFRDDKTYRSYCNILNKGGPAVDPENPQVRYEKALKVYQDYRNKCYLHPKRHHVRQLHRLLKAERLLPNDQKTPEALLARVELCLGGKTLNPTGSLNRRNEFLREENNIPPKNN